MTAHAGDALSHVLIFHADQALRDAEFRPTQFGGGLQGGIRSICELHGGHVWPPWNGTAIFDPLPRLLTQILLSLRFTVLVSNKMVKNLLTRKITEQIWVTCLG